jgi:hypothetical protein
LGIGILTLGGGVLTYALYDRVKKQAAIDEYVAKVQNYQREYNNAVDAGNYDLAQSISQTYSVMMKEEEEVINSNGWMDVLVKIVEALAALGIVAVIYRIGPSVVKWMIEKFPPSGPKCPFDHQSFTSESQLKLHLRSAHNFQEQMVTSANHAWQGLSAFWKDLVESFSGISQATLSTPWGSLPVWQLALIAIAAAVIIALTWGTATPALAPILAMMA